MKFTLAWLKDHLETSADAATIAARLTDIGLEIESVDDRALALAPFRVAHVLEAKPHPAADRLRVCLVDTGAERVQVVCGAPNARAGMKGVFAPSGVTVPGTGLLLKPTTIRGVASNGMLVSEREMGLSDEHEGIIELSDDAAIGQPFAALLGVDDVLLDVAVTPNRQDCLGVRGIARDLAAAGVGRLKPFEPRPVAGRFKSPIGVSLQFDPAHAGACPCFVGRYFRGLKNGPSPAWLRRRLRAIGLRPISALVDITNYVTFDLGRPLHVFDADKVKGDIVARLGRPGESLLALNGKSYAIDETMTVIADAAGPEGLGGVMGGEPSGCTPATVNMFLEVALFDPQRTAATGRRLGIDSDARYRFERGVDPAMVLPGAEHATHLILELCGGEASDLVVAGAPDVPARTVSYRPERMRRLSGLDLAADEQERILAALGFRVERLDGAWRVSAPTWRGDIQGPTDLVEEVARIAGFARIQAVPLPRPAVVARPALSPVQLRPPAAKRALAARGMHECVTYSFLSRRFAQAFGGGQEALVLENPISSELDCMRPSLLPNLLQAAARNQARGFHDLALFEVGPQYVDDTAKGQQLVAGGIRAGTTGPRHWAAPPRPVDAFDAKADALAVLTALGLAAGAAQSVAGAPAWYHPGRGGGLRLGPQTLLAQFGELHPAVLEALDVRPPVVGFEVYLQAVPVPRGRVGRARAKLELNEFQAVERDFAFVLPREVPAEAVLAAVRKAERGLIADVSVFDVYAGPGVGDGHKSVAVAVRLEPKERTLTEAEIEAACGRIVAAVTKATGATLRR
ncbi:MAG: phenylalanine--tRNA ligase subunit beta [Alphaproteobacteria bacterium]|nr:phenylalanine--tRNA ligase subunit beta [Alphaproteobacteria bacterium]